ncbi:discoidin domain-containing protein [Paenibacillus sp. R14(2021)]|uniref:endo-beta-N-acetylglucosaminidase n=1 Tax=Paenibacillus sp. R14(2021) TaxID=2859228 RepID=UPI002157F946|nr:discoidin domain-containing protein [Paenibacillus sp. R14(2021)]
MRLYFIRNIFALAAVFVASCMIWHASAHAEQPYSSYWFPKDLLNWSPETDKDAAFNKSGIPLASRYTGYQVNPNVTLNPKLAALSSMADHTSGTPSQGSDQFNTYAFQYWQYTDLLVDWAGSSGEGIIVPPSADATDAAHKNGVPILGTIFYPPTAYGGKIDWVNDSLVQNPDGSFPFADKLIDVANYYGFDGWFINQETAGGNTATATKMQQMLKYLQLKKPENMKIMWYDAMISSGFVSWQGALNANNKMFFQDNVKVSDSMFLDFRWSTSSLSSSNATATSLGRSPYELYAGIDVEANGYNSFPRWSSIFPSGGPAVTSLGLYRPDWAYKSSTGQADYYARENRFWVGPNGDPRRTAPGTSWPGIANYISDKTPVTSLPFVTNFNTGQGHKFAVNGEVLRTADWNNRSLQDVMPTWRWIADSAGTALKPDIDFANAYYGGSSLKISGDLSPANATQIKLYKSDLPVDSDTKLGIAFKLADTSLTASHMQVGISFSDDSNQFVYLDAGDAPGGAWTTKSIPIGQYAGKRIAAIGLGFASDTVISGYSVNIGQLSVSDGAEQPSQALQPGEPAMENEFTGGIIADARLTWTKTDPAAALYEIYRLKPDGTREFLGATPNDAYYVSVIKRTGKEMQTTLQIVGLDRDFRHGAPATVTLNWPEYPKPVADFTVSQRYTAPGQPIDLINQSSETADSVSWDVGGGHVDYSSGHPVVTYDQEGTYTITLTASNSSGEDVHTEQINVTWAVSGGLSNLALNKTATASSTCAASEAARFAFDGNLKTKWCANVGSGPHWVVSDLGSTYAITDFVISHAELGGEAVSMNTYDYKIQLSDDKVNWRDVVDIHGNTKGLTEHTIDLSEARYVRLWVTKPTSTTDNAARIYEFEIDGYAINPAFLSLNNASNAGDVLSLLGSPASPGLHLDLTKMNLLSGDGKLTVAQAIVGGKSANGYFSSAAIQRVIDQAVAGLDKTAPVTNITVVPAEPDGQNGWYVHPVELQLTASDDLSSVVKTEYSADGGVTWLPYTDPITLSEDAATTITYRSTDAAGNIETSKESHFKLDRTAPAVTASVYDGEVFTDDQAILPQIVVADAVSGVDASRTIVTLDGVQLQPGDAVELSGLTLGTHVLVVEASDNAGNAGTLTVHFQTTASIDSLRALVDRFRVDGSIDNAGIANSLLTKLENGNLNSFVNEVSAQSGKHISNEAAAYLLRDAAFLIQQQ